MLYCKRTAVVVSMTRSDYLRYNFGKSFSVFAESFMANGGNLCGRTVSALLGVPSAISLMSMWFSHDEKPVKSVRNKKKVTNFILYFFAKINTNVLPLMFY
jgi:hypothetical protein